MKKILTLTMILLLLALAACSESLPESVTDVLPTREEAATAEEHDSGETHAVHWGYEEGTAGGPENWAHLGYESCAGHAQSPINLTQAMIPDSENIRFDYHETAVKILNNGHTIMVDQITGSQIVVGGETYLLEQLHFHAPSEHTLNGQQFPLEMHLVHKTADKSKIAVVGIFVAEGAENSAFASIWAHLPERKSEQAYDTGEKVQLASLLPAGQEFYRYSGSLTTPPCTEKVLWSVMQAPVEMSATQIAKFKTIMPDNNRPVIYYRLQNMLSEESDKCLEGQGGAAPGSGATLDGAGFMDNCRDATGQLWKLTLTDNGYYRLQNKIGEAQNLCAEGNRLSEDSLLRGAFVMNECQDVSGQFWQLVDAGNGYYQLQTWFLQEENKCLEGQGGVAIGSGATLDGAAFMNDCQNVTGQLWKLIPINH